MATDRNLIGICPTFENNRPSHCPKCGSTDGFSKQYLGGMQTGDYICSKCDICIEDYVTGVMNLNLDGTPIENK